MGLEGVRARRLRRFGHSFGVVLLRVARTADKRRNRSLTLPDSLLDLTTVERARPLTPLELGRVLCPEAVDLTDKTVVHVGRHVEQGRGTSARCLSKLGSAGFFT